MAESTTITSASGLRAARVYELDASGYPSNDENGPDGYNGVDVTGVQAITLSQPGERRIQHRGNDTVFAQDKLPPTELGSGQVQTGKSNQTLDALLKGQKVVTVGEAQLDASETDRDGYEPNVMLVFWRQALDVDPTSTTSAGLRRWQTHVLPKTTMVPKASGAGQDDADVNTYDLTPTKVNATPLGVALSLATHGYTQGAKFRITGEYPMVFERFTGNGTLTEFNLSWTPISVAKTVAVVNGTEATVSAVNTEDPGFTLSDPAAYLSTVIVGYETTDTLG